MMMTEALFLGLITGGLGGNLLGKLFPQYSLGLIANTIAGIAGGGALSQILFTLFPILENASSSSVHLSFPGAITHTIVGVIGGVLVTMLIGKLKSKVA